MKITKYSLIAIALLFTIVLFGSKKLIFKPYYQILVYADSKNKSDYDGIRITERLYLGKNIFKEFTYFANSKPFKDFHTFLYLPISVEYGEIYIKSNDYRNDSIKIDKNIWYVFRSGEWCILHSEKLFNKRQVMQIKRRYVCDFKECPDSYKYVEKYITPLRREIINDRNCFVYEVKWRDDRLPGDDVSSYYPKYVYTEIIYFDSNLGIIMKLEPHSDYDTEGEYYTHKNVSSEPYDTLELKYQTIYEDTSYNQAFWRKYQR